MRKLEDFGKKIGGARKDEWKNDGLCLEDLKHMNSDEKIRYVTRDNVWPLPNAKDLVENHGVEPFVAYWQRQVRLCLLKEPLVYTGDVLDQVIEEYVCQGSLLRKMAMSCKTSADVDRVETEFMSWKDDSRYRIYRNDAPVTTPTVSVNLLYLTWRKSKYRKYVFNSNFPYIERKSGKKANRKKQFVPPQLTHIEREGKNYRYGFHVTPRKWQDEFDFYGVEFGNWTSQKDRQVSLDYCYDALKDLASVLDIEDSDIAFEGQLSLAFGARGCSHASAHYECLRRVINLTKMHGAGCTAHEWFHALDHYVGRVCKVPDGKFATETQFQDMIPESFRLLVNSLKKDEFGNETDYYKGSKHFDKHFAKDSYGCWSSTVEMAARAFACYVKDCLGRKSDYLIAHADSYEFEYDDKCLCAIPQGEEREIFNEIFDRIFYELKEMGYLHNRTEKSEYPQSKLIVAEGNTCNYDAIVSEDLQGQYAFQF